MNRIETYLFFDGKAAEAMRFYETTLGGKIETMMSYADMPPGQGEPGPSDRIMHASLLVGDSRLMASDHPAHQPAEGMHGFGVTLSYPTVAEGQKVFETLAAGGKVTMPFGKTFWVKAFGACVDRFGTPWMINGGRPAHLG